MLSLSDHDKAVLNCVFNPHLPLETANEPETPENLKDEEEPNTPEIEESKKIESDAILKADEGKLNDALNLLTKAIQIAPKRASLFNNRAQVHRLMGENLDALSDLTIAIELSNGEGKTGCQALCQRGILQRKAGRIELAKEDFAKAAKLGSPYAKSMLVEMNPYAALCNQMLSQVFNKEFGINGNKQ